MYAFLSCVLCARESLVQPPHRQHAPYTAAGATQLPARQVFAANIQPDVLFLSPEIFPLLKLGTCSLSRPTHNLQANAQGTLQHVPSSCTTDHAFLSFVYFKLQGPVSPL